jgi:hypothetical protein
VAAVAVVTVEAVRGSHRHRQRAQQKAPNYLYYAAAVHYICSAIINFLFLLQFKPGYTAASN